MERETLTIVPGQARTGSVSQHPWASLDEGLQWLLGWLAEAKTCRSVSFDECVRDLGQNGPDIPVADLRTMIH